MKNKINKIILLIKKDGFFNTIKKIYRYIKGKYLIKINIFSYLYIKINSKKIRKNIREILDKNDYDRIIVWRSSFGWNVPLFQRPQHIARNLAKNKCIMFYEITTITDKVKTYKEIENNLFLVNFNNSAMKKLLLKEINKTNKHKYIQFYCTDCTVSVKELKEYINNGYKVIYEYIDDISPLLVGAKDLPINLKEKYEYMLKDTENVFAIVSADEIEKDVVSKRGTEKLSFICNGVDYNHFANIDSTKKIDENYIEIIKQEKPIIGYYGALASWFDYDMVKQLADKRPNYNIVLFGIKYDGTFDKAGLEKYSNIYFLGAKNYEELPNYASKFTVCSIPFLINGITQATSPLKLFEYMALNKPIVTTAMNECKKYKSVMIANNNDEFIELIDKAIEISKTEENEYYEVLKKEALENTWEEKAKDIIDLLKKYE